MEHLKIRRRTNLRLLAQAAGGIGALSKLLDKSPNQMSHLIGTFAPKNIGDRLAAEIEAVFRKPSGWLDGHYANQAEEIIASALPPASCFRVPYLTPQAVVTWVQKPDLKNLSTEQKYIYTSTSISTAAYAMEVMTDSMESTEGGLCLCKGATIIVDPIVPLRTDNLCLVQLSSCAPPLLRRVISWQTHVYLEALNTRYPRLRYQPHFLYCGTIKACLLARNRW